MGVSSCGRPLTWKEIDQVRALLKGHALTDLIELLSIHRQRSNEPFLWGDEIEYSLVRFDHEHQRVQLLLKAEEILNKFNEQSKEENLSVQFHAEDCNFVIEGIPSIPYGSQLTVYNQVENNMKQRRDQIQKMLDKDEFILTISAFPRLGCYHCTSPMYESDPENSFERSITCADQYKTPNYPRTMFLNRNVIERRQSKVSVNVPVFKDTKTAAPFVDEFSSYGIVDWPDHVRTRRDDHIHLDSSSNGWGCCCLQVTLQASSFDESLLLYDQLIPLTPIFLSLSTSCPIWRGYLSEVDSRWNVLSDTTDDRTDEEIEKKVFKSSRYASVSSYLDQSSESFNDCQLQVDEEVYQTLIEHDCPSVLAKHFAHLFLRDPLYVTDEQVRPTDDSSTPYGFENHNSMVWNSLRFKPPISDRSSSLGWRIEFRPMELQISDFENAALTVFLILLTRSILSYRVDLRMFISLVDQNMQRAQRMNTTQQMRFHFPTHIASRDEQHRHATREMTIDEIINGSENFLGLKVLVENYLNSFEDIEMSTRQTIDHYLHFISERAKGHLLTDAMWIRRFVANHPLYQHDSIVTDRIQYDLIGEIERIANHRPWSHLTTPSKHP